MDQEHGARTKSKKRSRAYTRKLAIAPVVCVCTTEEMSGSAHTERNSLWPFISERNFSSICVFFPFMHSTRTHTPSTPKSMYTAAAGYLYLCLLPPMFAPKHFVVINIEFAFRTFFRHRNYSCTEPVGGEQINCCPCHCSYAVATKLKKAVKRCDDDNTNTYTQHPAQGLR